MKPVFLLLISFVLFQSCITLINTSSTQMEIISSPKVKIPSIYKNVAVRYNNSNVAYNPKLAIYGEGKAIKKDPINIDSIASKVYFNSFVDNMNYQILFDSVHVLEPGDYSEISIDNTLKFSKVKVGTNSSSTSSLEFPTKTVYYLSNLLRLVENDSIENEKTVALDPKLGLYTKFDLKQIRDTTHADLLLSLDFFYSYDEIFYDGYAGVEAVFSIPFWSFYDLKRQKIIHYHFEEDSLFWVKPNVSNLNSALRRLPSRNEATINAAQISAGDFASTIAPSWLLVDRLYYQSGNKEMRQAEKYLKQNKWLDAAKIWNKNSENDNKIIAAKSMFNLGLACEMHGEFDAAIDWISKSNAIVKDRNEAHTKNCANYIKLLNQRKLDIRSIETQLSLIGK